MAKIFGAEVGANEIDSAGKWVDKILNSRVGLALLIWGTFQFSLAPKLDDISRDTGRIASTIDEAKRTSQSNHEILVRLVDRCESKAEIITGEGDTVSAARKRKLAQ